MNAIFDFFIALKNANFWPRRVSINYEGFLCLAFNNFDILIHRDEATFVRIGDSEVFNQFYLSEADDIVKFLKENV